MGGEQQHRAPRRQAFLALERAARQQRQMESRERQLRATVRTARKHGASWAAVADALGVTRQAAWERFGVKEA